VLGRCCRWVQACEHHRFIALSAFAPVGLILADMFCIDEYDPAFNGGICLLISLLGSWEHCLLISLSCSLCNLGCPLAGSIPNTGECSTYNSGNSAINVR
jgi:hypothetical protein